MKKQRPLTLLPSRYLESSPDLPGEAIPVPMDAYPKDLAARQASRLLSEYYQTHPDRWQAFLSLFSDPEGQDNLSTRKGK